MIEPHINLEDFSDCPFEQSELFSEYAFNKVKAIRARTADMEAVQYLDDALNEFEKWTFLVFARIALQKALPLVADDADQATIKGIINSLYRAGF